MKSSILKNASKKMGVLHSDLLKNPGKQKLFEIIMNSGLSGWGNLYEKNWLFA